MATHPSILAWRIPWTEEPGGLLFGVAESDMTEQLAHARSVISKMCALNLEGKKLVLIILGNLRLTLYLHSN